MFPIFQEEIKPESKFIKDIPVSDSSGQSTILPCYGIFGREPGPVLCVTSGVHGAEYPGIDANLQLYRTVEPQNLKGTIIGCFLCNYEAFREKTMFVNPLDQKDLNHTFPGDPQGSVTQRMAHVLLTQLVATADYHIDMHSGDSMEYLHPYVFYHKNPAGRSHVDEASRRMASAYGLDYIAATQLDGNGDSDRGNFYSSASEAGIPSIQPELGGMGLADAADTSLHYQGLLNVLALLHMYQPSGTTVNHNQRELAGFYRLKASYSGVYHRLVSPGQQFQRGEKLAIITDCHGQKELECFTAPENGVVLWTMGCLAAKQGDTLLALGSL